MSHLQIFLLGPPHLALAGAPRAVQRRKAFALLAYLAVAGEPQPRDTLATLLWPESSQPDARKALRRDLSELNLSLGGAWIEAARERIGLRPGYWLDVAEFQHRSAREDADSLLAAATLYRGDLLAGFTLLDCPAFDEWQYFQGESLRRSLATTLDRLVAHLIRQAAHESAIPHARRRVALDPLDEAAQRQLMRLYAQAGQQRAALRQYDLLRQTLDTELGASPSDETAALYGEIRGGREQGAATSSPVPRPSHLPTQTTTFVGRQDELAEIRRLLLAEPGCRLLNLVGPGGTGKTRLALAAMAQLHAAFADGVHLVALAPVGEAADLVPTIANALDLTFFGSAAPTEQLLSYLAAKRLLLVVDNFEHLLEEAALLSEILARAPHVTLLATSRERLKLREEWVYDVPGLTLPPPGNEPTLDWSSYSAVELFTQRARQTAGDFSPTGAEMAALIRICRLVEGMPLALELAAPWTRLLSCHEIADEIQRSLDFLSTPLRNMPERHRSIGVVFAQTWQRLSDEERMVLQRLSVFRGGCTRQAAEVVAGATLSALASLVDKALVRRTPLGRYELHELIRQFAEAQLQRDPATNEQARQRHQDYFISLLETRTADIKGQRQKAILHEVKADIDNVRLAWRQAVAKRDAKALARAVECFFIFYVYSSGHYEGQISFQQAVAAFTDVSDPPANDLPGLIVLNHQENLVGFLLAIQAYFLARTSGSQVVPEQAIIRLLQAKPGDKRKEAIALALLSWAIHYQGRIADAMPYTELALELSRQTGELLAEWWSLMGIAGADAHGQPAIAEQVLKQALAVSHKSSDPSALAFTCQMLAWTAILLGRYGNAAQYIDQATRIFEELGNTQGLGYAFLRAGHLATVLGESADAIGHFRQALACFEETRSSLYVSVCAIWYGMALRLAGDYHQAEQILGSALASFQAMNNFVHAGYCLLNLGCLAQDQGDLTLAEQLLREALSIGQQERHEARVADASRCLGHLMIAAADNRQAEARFYFRQTLKLALDHQLAPIALDVCIGVAQLLAEGGEIEHAIELLALAEYHEASTFETRMKARDRLHKLRQQTRPALVRGVQDWESTPDLWTIAQRLLAQLATER